MRSCGGLPAPGQAGAVSSLLSPSLSFPPLMQSSAPTRGSSLLAPPLALSLPPAFPLRRHRHASSARPRPSSRFPPSPLTPPAYSQCCALRRGQRLRAPRFPAAWPAVALLPSSLPPSHFTPRRGPPAQAAGPAGRAHRRAFPVPVPWRPARGPASSCPPSGRCARPPDRDSAPRWQPDASDSVACRRAAAPCARMRRSAPRRAMPACTRGSRRSARPCP